MKKSFEEVWEAIVSNVVNTFYTKTYEPFTYQIVDNCFIPLRPDKAPKVTKEYVKMAYEQWPVKGPDSFTKNILAPSYLWGVFNDMRIISKEK